LAGFGLDKPIVVTETTLPSDNYGSDELQSRYAVQVFARSFAADVEATTWHRLKDMPGESAYGLLDTNSNPKPSYWAYKVMTEQLTGYEYVRELDVSGIEGYVFDTSGGSEKTVLWATSETTIPVTFSGSPLRVVDKWGNERMENDPTVDVTASPIFVEQIE
jgi:hypothetical protein